MSKDSNTIILRVDAMTRSRVESYTKINNVSTSDFMRKIIDEYFNKEKITAIQDERMKDNKALTDIIVELNSNILATNNNVKKFFKNLLKTDLHLNPKAEKEIMAIWRGEDGTDE